MKIRSIPDLQSFIALRGRVIVDTYRGQVRIRSWPKKQTEAHKAKNANRIRWFAAAREMAKWATPHEINATKEAAKGSGLYPGDLQMMAAAGNLIPVIHGEPQNYEKWEPRLEPVSFQGCRLGLPSNQAMTTGAFNWITWDVPFFQTTQFWTAGDPTHLVIPAGVTMVQLHMHTHQSGSVPTFTYMGFEYNDTQKIALYINVDGTTTRGHEFTGPFAVTEGDTFRCGIYSNASCTLLKSIETWLTLEVLETDI